MQDEELCRTDSSPPKIRTRENTDFCTQSVRNKGAAVPCGWVVGLRGSRWESCCSGARRAAGALPFWRKPRVQLWLRSSAAMQPAAWGVPPWGWGWISRLLVLLAALCGYGSAKSLNNLITAIALILKFSKCTKVFGWRVRLALLGSLPWLGLVLLLWLCLQK